MHGVDDKRATDLLGKLFGAYPSIEKASKERATAYLEAVAPYRIEALEKAVEDFIQGMVDGADDRFVPSAPILAKRCRLWNDAIGFSQDTLPQPEHGVTKINYGGRDIDTSRMTNAELDRVLASSGRDIPQQQIGRTVVPRLGKM